MKPLNLLLAASAIAGFGAAANATSVDLELVLLTDVSGSVDSADYDLMRAGYAAAFRSANVISAILDGSLGSIAVQVIQFSSSAQTSLGWTVIDSAASANAFADSLDIMTRLSSGSTGITSGLIASVSSVLANNIESTRQVIDVATDGSESVACSFSNPLCGPLQDARDAAFVAGIDTINGLLINDRDFFGDDAADQIKATLYAQNNIIGGTGSFSDLITDFSEFEAAISSKLVREIDPTSPVPVPAAGWLLASALGALVASRKKARSA